MKTIETHTQEMLIRVRQYGVTHAGRFPAGTSAAELLALVDGAIKNMEGHSADQAQHKRAAREKTRQKLFARRSLVKAMRAITRTARAMARDAKGLEDKFGMPEDSREQAVLATARAFAADAEQLKDLFIKNGMAATFLEDFRALIRAVEESVEGRAQMSAAFVSATVGVGAAAETGRAAVRDLGAVVHNLFAGEPALLAEWASASHIERPPRRAGAKEASAAPAQS